MPVIHRFDGVAIRMYFGDHNPPHVHVVSPDFDALMAIADGRILRGSLPNGVEIYARAWVFAKQSELLVMWENCQL
jgi:hypothetical protein